MFIFIVLVIGAYHNNIIGMFVTVGVTGKPTTGDDIFSDGEEAETINTGPSNDTYIVDNPADFASESTLFNNPSLITSFLTNITPEKPWNFNLVRYRRCSFFCNLFIVS